MKKYTDLRIGQTPKKRGSYSVFKYGQKDPMTVGLTMPEAVLLKSRLDRIMRVKPN